MAKHKKNNSSVQELIQNNQNGFIGKKDFKQMIKEIQKDSAQLIKEPIKKSQTVS